MATATVVNPNVLGVATPVPLTATAADQFPADSSSKYLVVFNGGSGVNTVVFDDPTSQGPIGAVQFDPDVSVSIPVSPARRVRVIDAARHRAADGFIKFTNSAPTGVTVEVYGPLPH